LITTSKDQRKANNKTEDDDDRIRSYL
jgi:hypothetical protein